MANTWNGMTFTNIAMRGISTLEKALMPLRAFTLDLSPDIAAQGTAVSTRIVPAATAPTDLVDDESNSYASVVDDQTTTTVTVTLDPHPVTGFALTDTQAQEIAAGVWSDTAGRLVDTHMRAIGNAVLNTCFNLITNANYGAAAFTGAASTFDADDVADIKNVCIEAGWSMDEASLILQPDYITALEKDNAIQDASASASLVLQTGTLPNLSGFDVMEAVTLPPAGGTPASENLVGFASLKDGIALAMRGVDTQAKEEFLHYEILQGPQTGAVITYSAIFNRDKRQVEHVFEALYGASKAQGASIKRIVSA